MNAHNPKAIRAITTPAPFQHRPDPAGIIALRKAIEEGRDPVAEFIRSATREANQKKPAPADRCKVKSSSLALKNFNTAKILVRREIILAAITSGRTTFRQILEGTGISECRLRIYLKAMERERILTRLPGPMPQSYSVVTP
jgi:hypothetical protein